MQTLSLTGTWASDLARAWIVWEMMGTASALGILMLSSAIPGLFLILYGGVIVDRVNIRKLMMITKLLLAIISFTLAFLMEFSELQFWYLIVAAVLEGFVNAFDGPAYQAIAVRLVPRQDFQQALALNSTNFHMSRMLGPLAASALIWIYGPALVFLFDGVTFIALIYMLSRISLIEPNRPQLAPTQSGFSALLAGIRYVRNTPHLFYKVLQLVLTICLIFPLLMVVFRTYVPKAFTLSAEEFSFLFSFPAMGSMLGALSFAVVKPKDPLRALVIGVPGAAIFSAGVAFSPSVFLVGLAMSFAGYFLYLTFASLTVSLQLEVEEDYRGRLSSMIGMCFFSIGPLMGYPIGFFADTFGFARAIESLSLTFLLFSGVLAFLYAHRRRAPSQFQP